MKFVFILMFAAAAVCAEELPAPHASQTCIACHGPKGISVNDLWPNLAGQKVGYIMKQIHDFREGRRNDPLMSPIAKSLSEKDIKELAEYFSSLHSH